MGSLIRFPYGLLSGQLTPALIFIDDKMACAARATRIGSLWRSPVTRCLRTNLLPDVGEITFDVGGICNVAPSDWPEFILSTFECACLWILPVCVQ